MSVRYRLPDPAQYAPPEDQQSLGDDVYVASGEDGTTTTQPAVNGEVESPHECANCERQGPFERRGISKGSSGPGCTPGFPFVPSVPKPSPFSRLRPCRRHGRRAGHRR